MPLVLPQNPSRLFLGAWHPVPGKPQWVKGTASTAAIDPGVPKLKARAVPAARIAELAARFVQLQGLELDDPRDLDDTSLAALAALPRTAQPQAARRPAHSLAHPRLHRRHPEPPAQRSSV